MSIPNALTAPIDLTRAFSLEAGKDQPADRAKIATMAQEFEAMLLLQMVRQMRQSLLEDEEEETGLGNETMTDTFDVEFARYLSKAGGLGLRQMIERQVEKTNGDDPAAATNGKDGNANGVEPINNHGGAPMHAAPARQVPLHAAPALLPLAPAAIPLTPDAGLAMPIEGATTSSFGWRADPLHGRRTFHAGVDLRAAYGTDVPAAGSGKVTFAGERGGYGLMVVVEHDHGVETRYAHLASTAVQAGQSVTAGAILGRVGSTGRSTAPHLHFEVLRDGERVDPEEVVVRRPVEAGTGGS